MIPDKCPKCGETGILFAWGSSGAAAPDAFEFRCDSITKRRAGSDEWVLVVEGGRCITNQRDQLAERVKRLEEAGDKMLSVWLMPEDAMEYSDWVCLSSDAKSGWYKAKEAKP